MCWKEEKKSPCFLLPSGVQLPDPFESGKYEYMADLHALNSRIPSHRPSKLPESFSGIISPLKPGVWEYHLQSLPDRECADYLVSGLKQGFRIGFNYEQCSITGARSNMLSALQHSEVIDSYLQEEMKMGRIAGPIDPQSCTLHVNRFGVVPKGHQTGKWRLILDLSHPEGRSINDGVDPALCSLTYTSVDWAVRMVLNTGRGALLANLDLESAYRMIPVHPDDRPLLGMKWREQYMVDATLPFGLRSAPKIFNVVADCLNWVFRKHGVTSIHYLDDFLIVGRGDSRECDDSLKKALQLCSELGVMVSFKKLEGPSSTLSFLGILLDTVKLELRLPEEKLHRLKEMIQLWCGRKSCTKRELLSLLGHLHHACQVVAPGRSFLRRMIALSKVAKQLHHHIRLNAGFRSDLEWWAIFLADWNGVSMMRDDSHIPATETVTSDASGSWGCGAFTARVGQWFQCRWPTSWSHVHITCKELLPVVVACAIWGRKWSGSKVECITDNAAVVAIVNSGKSQDELAMHLMRCLFFFTASWNITVHATHIAGKENVAADALSRDNLPLFFQVVPQAASRRATPIPEELLDILVHQRPDWTSPAWRRLFVNTLLKV